MNLDGVNLKRGDIIHHVINGAWTVKSVSELTVEIRNEFNVSKTVSNTDLEGEAKAYGWGKPYVIWEIPSEKNFQAAVEIFEKVRSL